MDNADAGTGKHAGRKPVPRGSQPRRRIDWHQVFEKIPAEQTLIISEGAA